MKKANRGYKVVVRTTDGRLYKEYTGKNAMQDALYMVDVLIDTGYEKEDIEIKDNNNSIKY